MIEGRTRESTLRGPSEPHRGPTPSDQTVSPSLSAGVNGAQEADVVATLVHELRTPLASLFATLEILDDPPGTPAEESKRWVRHLQRNVNWLQNIIENAGTWAMLETKRLTVQQERVYLPDVVDRAVEIVQPLLEKKQQQVQVHCAASNPWMLADSRHLVQVLVNLLNNAGAYGPKGDTLVVTVAALDQWVQVAVTDHGPGLSKAEQQQVFDRYTRGTAGTLRRGGMGIGLHIVRTLVETYGGEVGVDSTPGCGATFWLRIPAAPVPLRSHSMPAVDTHTSHNVAIVVADRASLA